MTNNLKSMSEFEYVPPTIEAFIQFLMYYAILPEMEPYQHNPTGLLSVTTDVAERAYQPGLRAVDLLELYAGTHIP